LHLTPEQCVFMDESCKNGRSLCHRHGHAPAGERAVEVQIYDRGEHWSILPAISIDGYIALCIVCRSVDGAEFYDFIINDVVHVRLLVFLLLNFPTDPA
jgi:DDE superfamily endonuclease